eukprot:g12061.t1
MGQTAMRESFEKERAILARSGHPSYQHPHIVKMYECFEERQSLWVVLELCKGGELYEYVAALAQNRRTEGGALEEPQAKHYFRQMIHAVSFLHKVRIVQRDIKTENFLLMGDVGTPEGSIIKLCDFGTAVQLSPQMPRAMGRIGTLSYTAPEIYARLGADLCADLWSLGVVLYVLLVGASPFRITGNESRAETSKRILAGIHSEMIWPQLAVHCQPLLHLLLAFSRLDPLQQLFMMVCAQVTPDTELLTAGLRLPWYDLFFALDEDCDGRLGLLELQQGLERLAKMAPLRQEINIKELLERLDAGHHGFVGWVQWTAVALTAVPNLATEPEPLQTVFRTKLQYLMMDRPSCDGIISALDLMALLNDGTGRAAAGLHEEAVQFAEYPIFVSPATTVWL